jgi:hypothetical protein
MSNRDKAKKIIKDELEPLAIDLQECINEGADKWLERQLSRIEKAKSALMELTKEENTQDFYNDDFGGQF